VNPPQERTPPVTPKPANKSRRRDGLFQRRGWWWLDCTDADGKRHRQKGAPDYQTAKLLYRQTMTAIAKGEVTGVREEGMRLREFVDRRYWPTVKTALSAWEVDRARRVLDRQLLPRFGDAKLVKLRREEIERWQAERLGKGGPMRDKGKGVAAGTANKELMRLKHILNRAVAWGYLRESPARHVKKVEAPGRVRYRTPEERNTLLTSARSALRPYRWTPRRAC
jgi:hypothetical protein